MEALIADLRAQGDERAAALDDLQQELSAEQAARLVEAAAAEALRDRLENADAELTAMTLALEAQRREAENTLTLLAASEAAQAALNERLEGLLSEIEAAQAQLQDRDALAERLTRVLSPAGGEPGRKQPAGISAGGGTCTHPYRCGGDPVGSECPSGNGAGAGSPDTGCAGGGTGPPAGGKYSDPVGI